MSRELFDRLINNICRGGRWSLRHDALSPRGHGLPERTCWVPGQAEATRVQSRVRSRRRACSQA